MLHKPFILICCLASVVFVLCGCGLLVNIPQELFVGVRNIFPAGSFSRKASFLCFSKDNTLLVETKHIPAKYEVEYNETDWVPKSVMILFSMGTVERKYNHRGFNRFNLYKVMDDGKIKPANKEEQLPCGVSDCRPRRLEDMGYSIRVEGDRLHVYDEQKQQIAILPLYLDGKPQQWGAPDFLKS